MAKFLIILLTMVVCSLAQHTYYHGPVGYPVVTVTPPSTSPQQQSTHGSMGDRFNNGNEGITKKPYIPVVVLLDPEMYNYYLGLPIVQKPLYDFNKKQEWNYRPQTYPLKPNIYAPSQANMADFQ